MDKSNLSELKQQLKETTEKALKVIAKNNTQAKIFVASIPLSFIFFIILLSGEGLVGALFSVVLFFGFILLCGYYVFNVSGVKQKQLIEKESELINKIKNLEFEQKLHLDEKILEEFKKKYTEKLNDFKVVQPSKIEYLHSNGGEVSAWMTNNYLCLAANSLELINDVLKRGLSNLKNEIISLNTDFEVLLNTTLESLKFIPVKNILYWRLIGEKTEQVLVSGGGSTGGGVSVGGAVLGSLIAGPAGMLLGGRKKLKVNEIKSEIKVNDTRKVEFYYVDEDKITKKIIFEHEDIEALKLLIPFKEYDFAIQSIKNDDKKTEKTDKSYEEKLNKLSDLFEKKLITKEEYEKKRKKIIDSI